MSEKKYPIGEVRVYFVFKHPKTGEEMSSKLYTPLELLDTDLSIINERTCVCDCKPVGETNVVECNCDDYYQDFQFHSYQVELAQPGPVWVKASERLPGWRTPVRWRLKGVEMKKYDVAYISQAESPAHWMDLEWLDESATPSESPS